MHIESYLVILFYVFISSYRYASSTFIEVGCYSKNNLIDFKNENGISGITVSKCIRICRNKRRRLAGLSEGSSCQCGEFYRGASAPENCNLKCTSNGTLSCGGTSYVSIYETKEGMLSSPRNLTLIEAAETGLRVKWEPPLTGFSTLKEYEISVIPEFSYNERNPPSKMHVKLSPSSKTSYLENLTPGSKYKIVVQAFSEKGKGYPASILTWTTVGKPERPEIPEIITKTTDSMIVQLKKPTPTGGPISSYQLIVVDETLPIIIDFDSLYDYYNASQQSLPYYIAAEIRPEQFDPIFKVGDGKKYGKYFNAPLKVNVDYHILLGVTSTINETKSSYSLSTHSQHESSDLGSHGDHHHHAHDQVHHFEHPTETTNSSSDGIVLGLAIAIGFLGFAFVASVLVYFALKVFFKRAHRNSVDHQELAVHAQTPNEDTENACVVGSQYIDNEEPQPDYYRLLRQKVSVFSPHHLTIVNDLGSGSFGEIKKVLISENHLGIAPRNALAHQISDSSLQSDQKSEMLKKFDQHIRIGKQENIISLLGLMEDLKIISLIFEYESMTLKTSLEESRAVQHYPVYAEKNRRFSTLQENQVLGILAQVAKGLNFMHSQKIPHGNVCARSIVLVDGVIPKISCFGLLSYHNNVYIPDYRRWQAPEYLKTQRLICQNDIWSFGCLMWEVVTLGGTPYADVRTEEIQNRIIRGLRLLQPQYVSDDLYQAMLLCWQNDPAERPPLCDLQLVLHNLISDDVTPHLLFSLYQSFSYEMISKHLEFID